MTNQYIPNRNIPKPVQQKRRKKAKNLTRSAKVLIGRLCHEKEVEIRQCGFFCAFRQCVGCGNAEPRPRPELHVFGSRALNWNFFRCGSEAIVEIPRSMHFYRILMGFGDLVALAP